MSNSYDDNDVTFRICAVLPASGTGSRMAMQIPKQYYEIAGKPLLMYTVEAFDKISWIEKIVIVVPEAYEQYTKQLIKTHDTKRAVVVTGEQTRHRSIYNGLMRLKMDETDPPDVVIIHDAVRPIVNEDILRSVAMAAMIYGAAGCTRPLVSTVIKTSEDNILDHSLERSKYRASETPQAFQYDVIKEAYDKCTDYDFDYGTECLHLAYKYADSTVKLVDGPPSLWKITYKKDLYAFEGIIKEYLYEIAVIIGNNMAAPSVCASAISLINKGLKVAIIANGYREEIQSSLSEVSDRYLYHDVESITEESIREAFQIIEDNFQNKIDIIINCIVKDYREATENAHQLKVHLDTLTLMLSNVTKCSRRQGVIVNSILITGNNVNIFDDSGLRLEAILKAAIRDQSRKAIKENVQVFGVFNSPHLPQPNSDDDDENITLELGHLATDIAIDIKNYASGQMFYII